MAREENSVEFRTFAVNPLILPSVEIRLRGDTPFGVRSKSIGDEEEKGEKGDKEDKGYSLSRTGITQLSHA